MNRDLEMEDRSLYYPTQTDDLFDTHPIPHSILCDRKDDTLHYDPFAILRFSYPSTMEIEEDSR